MIVWVFCFQPYAELRAWIMNCMTKTHARKSCKQTIRGVAAQVNIRLRSINDQMLHRLLRNMQRLPHSHAEAKLECLPTPCPFLHSISRHLTRISEDKQRRNARTRQRRAERMTVAAKDRAGQGRARQGNTAPKQGQTTGGTVTAQLQYKPKPQVGNPQIDKSTSNANLSLRPSVPPCPSPFDARVPFHP